jgi:hypothetical protein
MTTEETPALETHQESYKNYADYNGVLRTWFVSFGLGALVLFMIHPDFVNLLREKNHFLIVVLLFLAGCLGQIAVALINKFSSWHVYDATKKGIPTGKWTSYFYNAFWIDKFIDTATVVSFIIAIGLMVFDFVLTAPQAETTQASDPALVSRCSDGAAKAYQRAGFDNKGLAFYKNHWNNKQGKCFIQINAPGKDNFLMIDVYDVFENKRYAEFNGHQICDVAIVGDRVCQLDSATIWSNGNDERPVGEYNFGFNGLKGGRIGTANTQKEFLEHIRPYMTD